MYNISEQSVQKLIEVNRILNLLEVKGASNVAGLYNAMVFMQDIIKNIEDNTKNIAIENK